VLEDSKGFLRPDDLASERSPAEASRVAGPLSLRQVRLAPPLLLLGLLAPTALCMQCLVSSLEILNRTFQVIKRAPERFSGIPLCAAQQSNNKV